MEYIFKSKNNPQNFRDYKTGCVMAYLAPIVM
jgi:hypothetical protein